MTAVEIAVLGFSVAGFLLALYVTLVIRDVARDVDEMLRRDEETPQVETPEPTPGPRSMWGPISQHARERGPHG